MSKKSEDTIKFGIQPVCESIALFSFPSLSIIPENHSMIPSKPPKFRPTLLSSQGTIPGSFFGSLAICVLSMMPTFGDELLIHHPTRVASTIASTITDEQAAALAKLALDGLHREYPNKPSNVLMGDQDVKSPMQLHPAFYGCFDWHSSVHGHWMLVRLLKTNPQHALAVESRAALMKSLSKENIAAETAYFLGKENRSFERMYGWAWLLQLVHELHGWDDADGKTWRANLDPLEDRIVELTLGYLPRLSKPIRTGVHPDTAFALALTLDYARAVHHAELETQIMQRAKDYYAKDIDYASAYEPSGEDFFSASLNEANLMRRIMDRDGFQDWFSKFLVFNTPNSHEGLLTPVEVSDVTDGKLVHLAGLNLSRSWCLHGIASALPEDSSLTSKLLESAAAHETAGLKYVFSGHYEGEHWLGTFAVYTMTRVGTP